MCFSAAMRRPLRSKRARISPVSPRANASGLTRIRVRSIGGLLGSGSAGRRLGRSGALRGLGRALRGLGALRALRRLGPAAPAARRLARDLRLAVGAELPLGVQRLAADAAGVLEL